MLVTCMFISQENGYALRHNLAELKTLAEETLFLAVCPDPAIQELHKCLRKVLNIYPSVHSNFKNSSHHCSSGDNCNLKENAFSPPVLPTLNFIRILKNLAQIEALINI